ncbi:Glutathione S-transferase Mu 1 [Halotydeus destructor]|nr:Glutathione S-transferase Mu 1 [Halotydeus destructor]
MAPLLGYWNLRGLGQSIRNLLAHAGVEFEDKLYIAEQGRDQWLADKATLGLDFPNLPYYIDGDVKLSQSIAILRYIARQHGLDGVTNEEKARIDLAEQQLVDYRTAGAQLFYSPNHDELAGPYREGLPAKLQALSDFLGDRKWLSGDNLSYADFLAYEYLDIHKLFQPGCLDPFQNLVEYVARFEALPNVQKYMKSDKFMKWPANGNTCQVGRQRPTLPGPVMELESTTFVSVSVTFSGA